LKVLLQRVSRASVSVAGAEVGKIGRGLVALIGVADGDTEKDAQYLMQKIVNLRIFTDAGDRFNLSVLDVHGELLLVSQFTLLADTRKGRRPSFTEAAPPERAEALFNYAVGLARESGLKVATGRFQQHMQVEIHNDGPVTVMLDSKEKLG
jgi:D-tyrosyl-tRNA(Tyr) deacylase